jgi:hypothetical protein
VRGVSTGINWSALATAHGAIIGRGDFGLNPKLYDADDLAKRLRAPAER